ITGMCVSFLIAALFALFAPDSLPKWINVVVGVGVTTVAWIAVMYLTRPDDERTLREFYAKIRPGGVGWQAVVDRAAADGVPLEGEPVHLPLALACIIAGTISIYSALFATGFFLYGDSTNGTVLAVLAVVASFFLWKSWMRISAD